METVDNVTFELWEMETRNLVGTYPSFEEAVETVHEAVDTLGEAALDSLRLEQADSQGHTMLIAEGRKLLGIAKFSQSAQHA